MATGDTDDMKSRLRAVFPNWFADPVNSPIAEAAFTGFASGLSLVYSYIQFAKLQTRIKTATGGWLDLAAWDFFNTGFLRRRSESDDGFRSRVLKELLRPRLTKAAILQMLLDLTGRPGIVIELANSSDLGSWDGPAFGYDEYGGWGSTENNGVIIIAQRPVN